MSYVHRAIKSFKSNNLNKKSEMRVYQNTFTIDLSVGSAPSWLPTTDDRLQKKVRFWQGEIVLNRFNSFLLAFPPLCCVYEKGKAPRLANIQHNLGAGQSTHESGYRRHEALSRSSPIQRSNGYG